MRVLVACEFSGIVRDAFIRQGHDAWSCDLLPSESTLSASVFRGHSYHHYLEDALSILSRKISWDLLIAHPPCTFLTNAGVRWLYKNGKSRGDSGNLSPALQEPKRWREMQLAAEFFKRLLNAPIPRICVENPIMHKYAAAIISQPYSQIVHPWQFGHAETKATCLWLKNLPELVPTKMLAPDYKKYPAGKGNGFEPRVHHASPGPDRWKERSRTLRGIANAMAEQWGSL